jgi:hypothetical protein
MKQLAAKKAAYDEVMRQQLAAHDRQQKPSQNPQAEHGPLDPTRMVGPR